MTIAQPAEPTATEFAEPAATESAKPTEESSTHTNQPHIYKEGPENSGDACRGKSQSPINITNAQAEDLPNIDFHYEEVSNVTTWNNGHTVQAKYPEGYDKGYIVVGRERYNVTQFHYHAPSEHTLSGKSFAAELHIVHKNAANDKQLAVIAILLEKGAENPAYQPFLSNLPKEENEEIPGVQIKCSSFTAKFANHFSLTLVH